MTRDVFRAFINALRFSYELKAPAPEIEDFWYSKCHHIPDEALEWMRDSIKRDNPERFPKHFQDILTSKYYEWMRANPNRSAHDETCPECDTGWVVVRQCERDAYQDAPLYGDGYMQLDVAYACGRCNANKAGIAKTTKTQARRMGWTVLEAEGISR